MGVLGQEERGRMAGMGDNQEQGHKRGRRRDTCGDWEGWKRRAGHTQRLIYTTQVSLQGLGGAGHGELGGRRGCGRAPGVGHETGMGMGARGRGRERLGLGGFLR